MECKSNHLQNHINWNILIKWEQNTFDKNYIIFCVSILNQYSWHAWYGPSFKRYWYFKCLNCPNVQIWLSYKQVLSKSWNKWVLTLLHRWQLAHVGISAQIVFRFESILWRWFPSLGGTSCMAGGSLFWVGRAINTKASSSTGCLNAIIPQRTNCSYVINAPVNGGCKTSPGGEFGHRQHTEGSGGLLAICICICIYIYIYICLCIWS